MKHKTLSAALLTLSLIIFSVAIPNSAEILVTDTQKGTVIQIPWASS